MQLQPAAFNRFLSGIGQDVVWRRADACPCLSQHSGAADPSCPQCAGKGRTWRAGIPGRVGASSMASKKQYAQFGIFEAGDLLLTLPSDSALYEMGQFDVVQMPEASQPFSVVLTMGTNDSLLFQPFSIDRIFWLEDGAVVESPVREFAGKVIDWGAETQPATGMQYSVTGRWNPEYFVYIEIPTERAHHGGLALPRRVVVRRFDLYGRQ